LQERSKQRSDAKLEKKRRDLAPICMEQPYLLIMIPYLPKRGSWEPQQYVTIGMQKAYFLTSFKPHSPSSFTHMAERALQNPCVLVDLDQI
jgi:hypothetical protein